MEEDEYVKTIGNEIWTFRVTEGDIIVTDRLMTRYSPEDSESYNLLRVFFKTDNWQSSTSVVETIVGLIVSITFNGQNKNLRFKKLTESTDYENFYLRKALKSEIDKVKLLEDKLKKSPKVVFGKTGIDDWLDFNEGGNNYYGVHIKFIESKNDIPVITTMLHGSKNHYKTEGGSMPFNITETGFTVAVSLDQTYRASIDEIKSWGWHIRYTAISEN
jgi:hypothetical protein